jgi:hypothetical protein
MLVFCILYTFQERVCFSLISIFWPFPGLLVPTMTSASKISTKSPDFEFIYHTLMPFIYSQRCLFLEDRQLLPPDISWKQPKKPDQFAYTFLDRCLERIPSCRLVVLPISSTSIGGSRSSSASKTSTSTYGCMHLHCVCIWPKVANLNAFIIHYSVSHVFYYHKIQTNPWCAFTYGVKLWHWGITWDEVFNHVPKSLNMRQTYVVGDQTSSDTNLSQPRPQSK